MSMITISGTLALITSFIGLLPQIVKTLKTKSTRDISMVMLINYALCSIAWIVYGGLTDSMFVFSSNVLGLIISLWLIILKRLYDARYS